MKSSKITGLTLFFLTGIFVLLSANFAVCQPAKKMPRDIQWVTRSVEYAALCTQIYRSAWPIVKKAAQKQPENWVVVLDVDETVLDNSKYAVERAALDSGFTQASWSKWVHRAEAPPVPGVKALLDSVRSLGPKAHVAFITNRRFENEPPTVENLKKWDLYREGDTILTRKSREDAKADRRKCLEAGIGRCEKNGPLAILALFGDNIRDFMPMRGMATAQNYREHELAADPNWGTRFFMLPNPTYGPWERGYR